MNLEKQSGFTIIELTLFLGVSGLLFLLIFVGTGSTLRATRFTDSIRSTQSFLQKQADEILNGVNSRNANISCDKVSGVTTGAQVPGTSDCILIGRTLHFHDDVIDSYYIVGTNIPTLDGGIPVSDAQLILNSRPVLVKQSKATYSIPWQVGVSGGLVATANVNANTISIIRSPQSSQLYTYSTDNSPGYFDGMSDILLDSMLSLAGTPPRSYLDTPTTYCLVSPDDATTAAITLASNKNSDGTGNGNQKAQNAITTQFDVQTRTGLCTAGTP